MEFKRKTPSRFARRMANRLGKAVGNANKQLNDQFAQRGVEQAIRIAAATQFRHFTRELIRRAQAEEAATFGKPLTHREGMLRRKAWRAERSAA